MSIVYSNPFTVGADIRLNATSDFVRVGGNGTSTNNAHTLLNEAATDDVEVIGTGGIYEIIRCINAAMPTGDQQVNVTLTSGSNSQSHGGAMLRCPTNNAESGYQLRVRPSGGFEIQRGNAGSYTLLASGGSSAANTAYQVRCRATGTGSVLLEIEDGAGAPIVSYTDSSASRHETGTPGLGGYNEGGTPCRVDNFEVDDLQSGGTPDTFEASFDSVSVTSFQASINPGGVTISAAFDEVAVTSFGADIVPGEIFGADFTAVPITAFEAGVIPGQIFEGEFSSVPITSFEADIIPGTPAQVFQADFSVVQVTSFEADISGPSIFSGDFTVVPVDSFIAAVNEGARLTANFFAVPVTAYPADIRVGEAIGAMFTSVEVSGFPADVVPGAGVFLATFTTVSVTSFPAGILAVALPRYIQIGKLTVVSMPTMSMSVVPLPVINSITVTP